MYQKEYSAKEYLLNNKSNEQLNAKSVNKIISVFKKNLKTKKINKVIKKETLRLPHSDISNKWGVNGHKIEYFIRLFFLNSQTEKLLIMKWFYTRQ